MWDGCKPHQDLAQIWTHATYTYLFFKTLFKQSDIFLVRLFSLHQEKDMS